MTIAFKKLLTMNGGESGTLGYRLVKNIIDEKLQKPLDRIRFWSKAGFALAELGHGIIERYVAMEEEAYTASLSRSERAARLISIINATEWSDEPGRSGQQPEPAKPVTPAVAPQTEKPLPEKKAKKIPQLLS